jgi:spermidine synthase
LLATVLVIATCGLVYELITATVASYLLGDTVTQFSLVIGVYLSAMGLGSWLSKSITRHLEDRFVGVQLAIAIVGGYSATILFLGFPHLATIRPLLFALLVVVGTLVGLEIPLLMRILHQSPAQPLKDVVARVLAFDYVGALLASVAFPLVLLPYLGLVRTALVFGLLNALVAVWCAHAFGDALRRPGRARIRGWLVVGILGTSAWLGGRIEELGERQLYDAPVILSERTPYQRLTITRWSDDIRLYIDGNLQFSSVDEHRYHESLVHPAMSAAGRPERVLILGGGDGLAAREVLAHPSVREVDLVDIDPAMTRLFRDNPLLAGLNAGSLSDPRLTIHNADALHWLQARGTTPGWDVVVVDLPDPNNLSLGKLYTRSFYRLLAHALGPDGVGVVQATSPYLAPRSFWCIVTTLEAADLHVRPYHAHVPSFGDWGFALFSARELNGLPDLDPAPARRFLTPALLPTLFAFPADQERLDVDVNQLNDQILVRYYEQDVRATGLLPRS